MNKTMEDYIRQIPETLQANIENREALTMKVTEWMKAESSCRKNIVFVASGSSYNAIQSALPFMRKYMTHTVCLITPFEFCYCEAISLENLYLFVSQSGCSTNIVDAVKKYQSEGGRALAVTGSLDSTLSELADDTVLYGVGEESVGYVTKGVSALTLFGMLAALEVSRETMEDAVYRQAILELRTAADHHGKVYEYAGKFCRQNDKAFLSMEHVMLMSGGANMGTVREGALKLAEMLHVQTTFYEAEEFIHGPNLQVTPRYTLFFVEGAGRCGGRIRAIYEASKEITDHSFLISPSDWKIPVTDETVSPLYLTAFFQYLAFWAARELDIRQEHPFYRRFKQHISNKTGDYREVSPF